MSTVAPDEAPDNSFLGRRSMTYVALLATLVIASLLTLLLVVVFVQVL